MELKDGEALKELVYKSGIPITMLSKRMGFNRRTIYNHFTLKTISPHLSRLYLEALSLENIRIENTSGRDQMVSELLKLNQLHIDMINRNSAIIQKLMNN